MLSRRTSLSSSLIEPAYEQSPNNGEQASNADVALLADQTPSSDTSVLDQAQDALNDGDPGATDPTLFADNPASPGKKKPWSGQAKIHHSEPVLEEGKKPSVRRRDPKYQDEEVEYFTGGKVREGTTERDFEPNDKDKHLMPTGPKPNTFGKGHVRDADGNVLETKRTHMMDEKTKADHELHGEDGRLMKANGEGLDTMGAAKHGLKGTAENTYIYTLDTDGKMRAVDAQGHNQKLEADKDKKKNDTQKTHHSSLTGGGDVYGAGGIVAKEGHVKEVTTGSGHYAPKNENLVYTLDQLDEMGVELGTAKAVQWGSNTEYNAAAYQKTRGDVTALNNRNMMLSQVKGLGEEGTAQDRLAKAKGGPIAPGTGPAPAPGSEPGYEPTPHGTAPDNGDYEQSPVQADVQPAPNPARGEDDRPRSVEEDPYGTEKAVGEGPYGMEEAVEKGPYGTERAVEAYPYGTERAVEATA